MSTVIKTLIKLALDEDIGIGDCTTEALIDHKTKAEALISVKQPSRIAGLPFIEAVFATLDASVTVVRRWPKAQILMEKLPYARSMDRQGPS